MKKILISGIILVLLLACVGAVSANIITNGGFENPVISGNFNTYFAGDPVLAPWTIDAGSIDLIRNYWTPAGPSQSIDLEGVTPGSISQILTTTPNAKYDLSFKMAGNPDNGPGIKRVEIFWNGVSQGIDSFDTTGKTLSAMGWTSKGRTGLTASGTTTVLQFVDVSGATYYGAALDDIVVEPSTTPVPEFPSVALPAAFVVGLLGAVLFIRKSNQQ